MIVFWYIMSCYCYIMFPQAAVLEGSFALCFNEPQSPRQQAAAIKHALSSPTFPAKIKPRTLSAVTSTKPAPLVPALCSSGVHIPPQLIIQAAV